MRIEASVQGVTLSAEVIRMGEDLCAVITGGDRPHLGCAALAVPHPGISNPDCPSATVSTLNLPARRDGDLANDVAKELSRSLGHHAAVLCGVHFDSFSPKLMQLVSQAAQCLSSLIIQELNGELPVN